MNTLKIRNWETWQSYRKDRGQPPWIKIHRALLRNWEWISLTDAERGQLVAIWLLAADHDGVIPASTERLVKLTHMESPPDLQRFIELGFIEQPSTPIDVAVTPERRQADADATAQSRSEEVREEEKHKATRRQAVPVSKIVDLYHQILPELPQCKKLTTARTAIIRQRHVEDMEEDLETWASYFNYIKRSKFLMGREPPRNGSSKPFVASLDWVCKAENFAKIYEGKYHG